MALEKAENLLLNVRDTEIILLIGAHHAQNGLLGVEQPRGAATGVVETSRTR